MLLYQIINILFRGDFMLDFFFDFFVGFYRVELVAYPVMALGCGAIFHLAYKFMGR